MKNMLHGELKKEFQLERMILFSDAVFAIAITLLVIEMKVPVIAHDMVNENNVVHALMEIIPKFVGFIISFFIIGLYWTVHHRLFGFVINYNVRLLWLNLIFLLSVVLMPFSTGFYSEYIFKLLKTPVIIYVSNISFLGIMNFVLWRYVGNPKRHLTEGLSRLVLNYYSFRAIAIPFIFITMAMIYLFAPKYAIWTPLFIPLIMRLIAGRFEKKIKKAANASVSHPVAQHES
jgi:uncharacterized membrane protein